MKARTEKLYALIRRIRAERYYLRLMPHSLILLSSVL
jgi:hypothetical protein